ncbi:hypothetical protein, partial [Streptomyces sp. NPDC008121]|uniref:hypothetical protein n=1 Tax=Streptomyces sp. NPDC008121 TaxID=3364809 RepID=UPI0036E82145
LASTALDTAAMATGRTQINDPLNIAALTLGAIGITLGIGSALYKPAQKALLSIRKAGGIGSVNTAGGSSGFRGLRNRDQTHLDLIQKAGENDEKLLGAYHLYVTYAPGGEKARAAYMAGAGERISGLKTDAINRWKAVQTSAATLSPSPEIVQQVSALADGQIATIEEIDGLVDKWLKSVSGKGVQASARPGSGVGTESIGSQMGVLKERLLSTARGYSGKYVPQAAPSVLTTDH